MSSTTSNHKRIFALVDVNNFYVSCERIFDLKLRDRPVVVLSNNDGCCIARSNEAKEMNITMGQPFFQIRRLEDEGILKVRSSNYALYADISSRFREILLGFTPDVEVYSIDECFLDFSKMNFKNLDSAAAEIRNTVWRWIHLPVCVGIASTKTLAKLANHTAKKNPELNGICILQDESAIRSCLEKTEVENIWGIGPAYTKLLKQNGIFNALSLSEMDDLQARKQMTIQGLRLVHELRGISCIEMETHPDPKKNIAVSRSFGAPAAELKDLREAVAVYAKRACEKLWHEKRLASTISVMIRDNPFNTERFYSNYQLAAFQNPTDNMNEIMKTAISLLSQIYKKGPNYKKAGVILGGLIPVSERPGMLFSGKKGRTADALNLLIQRQTAKKLSFASTGTSSAFWHTKFSKLSPRCTTRWEEIPRVRSQ
ncbi:MAG: Y-family DNA polymerase [Spirochaetia bacterium]|nr:Y-family DNA polymerase [Spirochaetia bacterium]